MEFDINPNVELVNWISLDEWKGLERDNFGKQYRTFEQLASAIDEHGPYLIETDRANLVFLRTVGRFEKGIVVLRQSGLNIRRVYIDPDTFPHLYGDVNGCVNMLLSNLAIGPEVELAHLSDYASALELDAGTVDESKRYERDEIDALACLQIV